MRNILFLGWHEVAIFLRDKSAYVWLILMPVMMTFVMSRVVRGPGGPYVATARVAIENRDEGPFGAMLVEKLGTSGLTIVAAEEKNQADRGIIIPAEFSARLQAREQAGIEFYAIKNADEMASILVKVRVFRALAAMTGLLVEHVIENKNAPLTEEAMRRLMETPDPITVEAKFAGRRPQPVGFNFSLPGNLVGYLFLNLVIFGGTAVAAQRRNGVLRRLALNPVTRFELLFGKMYGLLLLGGFQALVLLGLGQFALGVDILGNLPGILLTTFVLAWAGASLGLLVGFLARSEEMVLGVSLGVGLPVVALGGCWWPVEFGSQTMQYAALAVPTGWGMKAMHQLITFGNGLEGALPAIGVIALFAAAANLAAMKFFRV